MTKKNNQQVLSGKEDLVVSASENGIIGLPGEASVNGESIIVSLEEKVKVLTDELNKVQADLTQEQKLHDETREKLVNAQNEIDGLQDDLSRELDKSLEAEGKIRLLQEQLQRENEQQDENWRRLELTFGQLQEFCQSHRQSSPPPYSLHQSSQQQSQILQLTNPPFNPNNS